MPRTRSLIAVVVASAALAACASSTPSTPRTTPTAAPTTPPEPAVSPEGGGIPVDQVPDDCLWVLGILPIAPGDPSPGAATFALRYELLQSHALDIAMVGVTVDGVTITPAADLSGDVPALVSDAAALIAGDGHVFDAPWTVAPALDWSFEDLCRGLDVVRAEMGAVGGVTGVGVSDDGHLDVGLSPGAAVPAALEALEVSHPGMMRITPDTEDVEADAG